MTILSGDIKFLESDTMTDADEGGGAVTGREIIDGQSNNILEDVSTLDRVHGAVKLRKIYGAVITQTNDKYFGSHIIISKLPADEKIGINLFKTGDWFDRRQVAQSRIENYLAQGGIYNGFLWATQYQGSRAVIIFQSETASIPGVGDVLVLKDPLNEQYIRITRIDNQVQTFVDAQGPYTRRILTLEISDILEHDFIGAVMSRVDSIDPEADIFNTVVANAARYYSARPLAVAASTGDLAVKVDSVYSQVVPSAQSETHLIDETAGGASVPIVESSTADVSFVDLTTFAANSTLHLGGGAVPGSLTIAVSGDTLTDVAGQIKNSAGTVVGTVTYSDGLVSFGSTSPTYSGSKTVTFRPAAAPQRLADTASLIVTAANRGYVWTININPAPLPTSVRVAYRALNKWYELFDNGGGGMSAIDSSIGSGTINYVTGSITVTLGVLPDADSEILFAWSNKSQYLNRSNISPPPLTITQQLPDTSIQGDSLSITWNDGTARTVTSDVAGNLTGDGSGKLNPVTGLVEMIPTIVPLKGTVIFFDYSFGDLIEKQLTTFGTSGNTVTLDLDDTNLVPGSVTIDWSGSWLIPFGVHQLIISSSGGTVGSRSGTAGEIVTDDGSGNLLSQTTGLSIGTINYGTGIAVFDAELSVNYNYYEPVVEEYGTGDMRVSRVFPSDVILSDVVTTSLPGSFNVKLRTAADAAAPTQTQTLSTLKIDITPGFTEAIVPGSFLADYGNNTYVDRQGQLYYDIDRETGAGSYAGTLDYSTGLATLTDWAGDVPNSGTLKSLLTDVNYAPVDQVVFRIDVAPVKVGSLSIRAVPEDGGGQITATAASDGTISTADMDGFIVYETGVVNVRFGAWVSASGNEGEWWYSAGSVVNGQIFKPRHVFADTIFYNAVSQTNLPLSAEILGLNPVRLPADGRVPIYAPGDVIVVLHDQKTTGTYSNGTQLDLARVRLAKVQVRDSGGSKILESAYTVNLDTGIIDWVDLAGISQPLTITDRIEDMAVISDVQITGELALSQPLSHDFPLTDTLVSNAVIYGDLFARTSIPFDQKTWTDEWSDDLIGSDTVAQYNNSGFPIDTDNASTIEEDWVIIFTSATLFNIIGRNIGQIATGNTSQDTAPINPNTLAPYFTIPSAGWGSGWSAGNVLRFKTFAANVPAWLIEAISQGPETDPDYSFCLEFRGDIDTP